MSLFDVIIYEQANALQIINGNALKSSGVHSRFVTIRSDGHMHPERSRDVLTRVTSALMTTAEVQVDTRLLLDWQVH